MRLLLIRHGESAANAEGRLQGHMDFPLSERGRLESERLAERLAGIGIDSLYTSPLRRARQTADIVAARLGLSPVDLDGLMERDVGDASGLTRAEIIARFPEYVRARIAGHPEDMIGGWEGDDVFSERVGRALHDITAAHEGQTVAAFTHGGVISAICRDALGLPVVRPGPLTVGNAGITTLNVADPDGDGRARPRLQLIGLNDTCHLAGL